MTTTQHAPTQDAPPAAEQPTGEGGPRYSAALAAAQAEMPPIVKDAKAKIDGREGKRGYEYSYADLGAICTVANPILGKHGLAFSSKPTIEGDRFVLRYKLLHESGEYDSGVMLLPREGTPQGLGSVITYYKRYAYCAITGISPVGEDDDAQSSNNEQRFERSAGEAFDSAQPAPGNRRRREQQDRPDGGQQRQDRNGQRRQEPQQDRPPVTVPPLDDEDPWKTKIADIDDEDQGRKVRAEVTETLAAGHIDQERANRLNAVITARAMEIEQERRQNGRPAGQAAQQPPPIRPETQGAPKRERTSGGNNTEWVEDFKARVAGASPDDLTDLQREIPAAVRNRTILPEKSAELSQLIQKRRHEASEVSV